MTAAAWIAPALYALSAAGLVWCALQAVRAGLQSYETEYTADTARQLEDLFLFIPAPRLAEIARLAALCGGLLGLLVFGDFFSRAGLLRGAFAGGLLAGGLLAAPRGLTAWLRARRRERFNLQLVDALNSMSNALRAGFSILQACESVAREGRNPIGQEFSLFLHEVRVGVRFDDALRRLEDRVGSEDLSLMAQAVEVARQTGGNLTEVFDKIAVTIRERLRIQGRIRSLTAQGRLQGIVVGCMPLALLGALMLLDPPMMNAFFHSRLGVGLLAFALALELCGAWFLRRIVRIRI